MSELRGLIKQFDNIAHKTDERRLKLEQMRLNTEKTKKAKFVARLIFYFQTQKIRKAYYWKIGNLACC